VIASAELILLSCCSAHLEATYCGHIGVEAEYVRVCSAVSLLIQTQTNQSMVMFLLQNAEEREWFAQAVESVDLGSVFSPADKRNIHSLLGELVSYKQVTI